MYLSCPCRVGLGVFPDPYTSARASQYKWEPYGDTNWCCIYSIIYCFHQRRRAYSAKTIVIDMGRSVILFRTGVSHLHRPNFSSKDRLGWSSLCSLPRFCHLGAAGALDPNFYPETELLQLNSHFLHGPWEQILRCALPLAPLPLVQKQNLQHMWAH